MSSPKMENWANLQASLPIVLILINLEFFLSTTSIGCSWSAPSLLAGEEDVVVEENEVEGDV